LVFQAPAVMLLSFISMFCVACAYRYMNHADPDCGTTFAWATRGLGPSAGWLGGWGIIAADVIVMATLAQIAAIYTFPPVRLGQRCQLDLRDCGRWGDLDLVVRA
jgi:amino acid transporter